MTVKILAYIERLYGPKNPDHIGEDIVPNEVIGYACDASIMLQFGPRDATGLMRLPIHYGDGKLHATFEEAQRFILDEVGVLVEPIPEWELPQDFPRTGTVSLRVGRFVRGFVDSGQSREEIEADQGFTRMPSGWRVDGVVDMRPKKPRSKPN